VAAWPWARWDQPSYAADADEPYRPPAYEPFDEGPEGEAGPEELRVLRRLPTELCNYLKGLPDARRPRYRFIGGLLAAAGNPGNAGMGGLYLIVFRSGGRLKAYNGISDDLRQRLQAHVACAARLGLERYLGKHEVFFAEPPRNSTARTIEISINRQFLKPQFNVLTNKQLEFEAELPGEGWL
jgi:predicted GIY-YIG superfamily endonuclease